MEKTKSSAHSAHTRRTGAAGEVYGAWTLVRYAGDSGARGHLQVWLAKCVCGTEREVLLNALRARTSQSCGCIKQQRRFPSRGKQYAGDRFARLFSDLTAGPGVAVKLADEIGCSRNSIYNFCYGFSVPRPLVIETLANALHVTSETRREMHRAAALDIGYKIDGPANG